MWFFNVLLNYTNDYNMNRNNHQGDNWKFVDEKDKVGIVGRGNFFSKRGVLNSGKNEPTVSNRRLTLYFLPPTQKTEFDLTLAWSIDRLTIVGRLKQSPSAIGTEIYEADIAMALLEEQGYARKVKELGWVVENTDVEPAENIGYFELLAHDREKGRFDFNPNKLSDLLNGNLKDFLHSIFESAHYSRADVACDIFNVPNDYIRQFDIVKAVSKREWSGIDRKLQTAYWGSPQSERQVRMYDKLREQLKNGEIIAPEIKTWWRLEFQLRGKDRTTQFDDVVKDVLESFVSLKHIPIDIEGIERATLIGLLAEPETWSGIKSSKTKAKYKKMVARIGREDSITRLLLDSYFEQKPEIEKELDFWLNGLNVI